MTEQVARRGKLSFQNVGGKGIYNVLRFQNSRGAKTHLHVGGQSPPPKCSPEVGANN